VVITGSWALGGAWRNAPGRGRECAQIDALILKGAQERGYGVQFANDRDGHDDRRDPGRAENTAAPQRGSA
jgi:hypothetical protein